LYTPTSIMVIKLVKVRWEENVAQMEDVCEMCPNFYSENLKGWLHGRSRHGWEDDARIDF